MKKSKLFVIASLLLVIVFAFAGCKGSDYKSAMELYENKKFTEAQAEFEALGDYKDSQTMVSSCIYEQGKALAENGDFDEAVETLEPISDYEDASSIINTCKVRISLNEQKFYFEASSVNAVNVLTFGKEVTVLNRYFDGNGIHDGTTYKCTVSIDDKNIFLSADGMDKVTIPYTMTEGTVVLDSDFVTKNKVEKDIQGYWKCTTYPDAKVSALTGSYKPSEFNLYLKDGNSKYEHASPSAYNADELFYSGPYSGKYTVEDGEIKYDYDYADNTFFRVDDGKVELYHYDHKYSKNKSNKLPGENGYWHILD